MSVPVEFCGSIAADAAGARDMRGGHREWQPGTKHTEAQLHFGDYPTTHECDTSGYTTSAWQKEARHPFDTAPREILQPRSAITWRDELFASLVRNEPTFV